VFSAFFHRIFSAEIPSENVRIWSHNFRSFSVKRTLNFRQIYTELPSNSRWISVYLTFFHRSFIIVFDQNSTTKKVEKTAETGKKRNYMLTITSVIFESAETKIGSANNITSNERIPENWIWCSIRMSISIGRVWSLCPEYLKEADFRWGQELKPYGRLAQNELSADKPMKRAECGQ